MIYKKNKVQSKFSNFILILTIIFILLNLKINLAYAKEKTIIKVGYPIVEGFTDIKNGVYTGYAFDYLFEISKYTGWQLEFIEMSLSEALDKLNSGEIDIVSGMIKNEQTIELFDFPDENSGYTYSTLATLQSNTNISRSDYSTLNGIKVGYFKKSLSKLTKLDEFFKSNNITNVTYVPYTYEDDNTLIDALNNKEVDAIITDDLLLNNNLKILKKFDSSPYYFATTKGKTYIKNGLNDAINKINESNPEFSLQIYNKYFQNKIDSSIFLNNEEQDYLSNLNSLKAIYVDNFYPIQYYDSNKNEANGIIVNIGKLIFEKLGVNFELIRTSSFEEAYKLLNENPDYLAIGVPANYTTSKLNNILFSKSYLDLSIVKVYSKSYSEDQEKILALPFGYGYNDLNNGFKIKYYDTIEDCLMAVENNEAYFTYSNYYTISKYIATNFLSNISIVTDDYSNYASFAFSFDVNKNLYNIINKAIMSISNEEINNAIYSASNDSYFSITFKTFFLSNLNLCLSVIFIILLIISILIAIIIKMKFSNLNKAKELLISKSQSDPLTGVYNRSTGKELINSYFDNFNNLYYCFIILDIDYFKQINDTFGHAIGDEVLIEFSKLLKQFFANHDIISRLGGDEFIVFMKDITKDECFEIVTKKLSELCNLMNKELTYNNTTQKVSISVGAIINNKPSSFNKLYEKSDKLLYKVKRNGRNGFEISSK